MQQDAPLPSHAPVMVVQGATLFPRTLLPLRIFEPRYRQMLKEALESHRIFALAMPDEIAEHPIRPIAGLGLIRMSVTNPDGTSEVLLQGLQRVRFTQWTQTKPFRIAAIQPFGESSTETPEAREKRRSDLLKILQQEPLSLSEAVIERFSKEKNPDHLVDMVAASVLKEQPYRQSILEEPDPIFRQELLIKIILSCQ